MNNNNSVTLNYSLYSTETGVLWNWYDNAKVSVNIDFDEKSCLISWNQEGLLSLAQHLVSLAQDGAPTWTHFHLDDFSSLEKGSNEIIFEKID